MSDVLYVVTDGWRNGSGGQPVEVQEWPIVKRTAKRIYAKDPNHRAMPVGREVRHFTVGDGDSGCDGWIGVYATDMDAAIAAYVARQKRLAARSREDAASCLKIADKHDTLAKAAEALSLKAVQS
jgi:hypothetical protein